MKIFHDGTTSDAQHYESIFVKIIGVCQEFPCSAGWVIMGYVDTSPLRDELMHAAELEQTSQEL